MLPAGASSASSCSVALAPTEPMPPQINQHSRR
jgi:hypothetical protein